jgi:hypothetical protein
MWILNIGGGFGAPVVVQGGKIVTVSQLQVRRNRRGKQGF